MKALILAAGFGTRLLPYTGKIPKPLFTLISKPVLAHCIQRLKEAGCSQVLINTHHLNEQIETFISKNEFGVDIKLLHEPDILDTGGAIKNAKPYLEGDPFFVLNADVFSSIDLEQMYAAHEKSGCLATLALCNDPRFNKVAVNPDGYVTEFNASENAFTFTGIQVLSPEIYKHFPDKNIFSSIEVYKQLCSQKKIKAFITEPVFWSDIGTPDAYRRTSMMLLCADFFGLEETEISGIQIERVAGDGSDREWHRARYKDNTCIISDHGICQPETDSRSQLNAFVNIGCHLHDNALHTPGIIGHDALSGMVIVEDLGNIRLEERVFELRKKKTSSAENEIKNLYQKVIDCLIRFSQKGVRGFDPGWTCQSETYSRQLILDKECRYFMEAFVNGYLGLDFQYADFEDEFSEIADQALVHGFSGLMHRDMQSRNIMIRQEEIFFVDFQSARIGPLQYDLASLLIDPYVGLSAGLREDLCEYTINNLNLNLQKRSDFLHSYQYCMLTRNLQFLGAFSFLTRIKKKAGFEKYIPGAALFLEETANIIETERLGKLRHLFKTVTGAVKNGKN